MKKVWVSRFAGDLDREMESALEWLDWQRMIASGTRVAVKPNLTYPTHKPGVTTTAAALEALVRVLRTRTRNINIVESDGGCGAWTADEAFAGHGIVEICRRYDARAINLSNQPRESVEADIAGRRIRIELPKILIDETDAFITVPVPKLHAMTGVSLGFKNQWGCLPDVKRLRHHSDFARVVLAINKLLKPRLAIFDGTWFLDRNGPLEGDPVRKNLLIASDDAGAGSRVCCELMGIDPLRIPHLRLAIGEGMMPAGLAGITLNRALDEFERSGFKLRRNPLQWLTLAVFHSRLASILLYDSPLAKPMHELVYSMRGRPADFVPKW